MHRLSLLCCSLAVLVVAGRIVAEAVGPTAGALAATSEARKEWTREQRDGWARELRGAYAKPPAEWPAAVAMPGVEVVELGPLPDVVDPADNPRNPEKTELGRMLFFDPRLSSSNQIACASCHDPDLGWADGRTVSFGHQRTVLKRNAPTAMHSGHMSRLFWDGRASTLEELTVSVIENQNELRSQREDLERELAAIPEYRERFEKAFGEGGVTIGRIAKAVAAFCRTLEGGRSEFDRFLAGRSDALSDAAVRGLHLFRTEGHCINCHMGPTLTDDKLHNTGLSLFNRPFQDLGAYEVTGRVEDMGAFKTPPLRHIARTRPYMHHGLFENLEVTVRAYNAGMPEPSHKPRTPGGPMPVKSPLIVPLNLSEQDMQDIIAFLEALTEPHRVVRPPALPPDPVAAEE